MLIRGDGESVELRLTDWPTDGPCEQLANREHRDAHASHCQHNQKGRNEVEGQSDLDQSACMITRDRAFILRH
jgi:hypothetical protein